jgi:diacylglycerol O-acyltransferase
MTVQAAPTIQRAAPGDVTELLCDTTGTSMQVGAVLLLDTALDPADVRAALAWRVTAVPRLRQRLVKAPFGCGRPFWSDDPDFDIDQHVRTFRCASPGAEPDLMDAVAQIITARLPPGRPLWSATVVTGLQDGRCALVVAFHHVLADGIGGLAVLARLVDGAPAFADPGFPHPPPNRRELFIDALVDRGRGIIRLPVALGRLRAAAVELGAGRLPRAPRTSLNRPVGRLRAVALTRVDLEEIHAAARSCGGTINDAVLSAVSGASADVLAHRGESVAQLVFSLPVSARRSAAATELGNRVGVMAVAVPLAGDPAQRISAIARITQGRKGAHPGSSAALFGPVFRVLARVGAFGWLTARQHLVNSFVTNLHGPDQQLSLLGARVVEAFAVPMITGNVTVAFSALSYAGRLTVAVVADPVRCPDLTDLSAALQRQLEAIVAAASHPPAVGTFDPAGGRAVPRR